MMSRIKRPSLNLFSPESSSIKDILTNIENNLIPHGHEKAFKQSLYNALAILLITLCGCTCYAVYLILQPFLKPLLWALICGTVLHPSKKIISNYLKNYFKSMQSYSMLIQTGYVPILFVDSLSDMIGKRVQYLWNMQYMFHVLGGSMLSIFVYLYAPSIIFTSINILSLIFYFINSVIQLFQHLSVIVLLCVTYTSLIIFFSNDNGSSSIHGSNNECPTRSHAEINNSSISESNSPHAKSNESTIIDRPYLNHVIMKIFSLIFWFGLSCHLTSYLGSYIQNVMLILIQFLFLAGSIYQWYYDGTEEVYGTTEGPNLERKSSIEKKFQPINKTLQKRSQSDPFLIDSQSNPLNSCVPPEQQNFVHTNNEYYESCVHTSDSYIYWVVCFCVVAAILQNMYLLCIFILFEIIYLLKKLCVTSGAWSSASEQTLKATLFLQEWFQSKQDIIFPSPLRGIRKLNFIWRQWCLSIFKDSSDAFASVIVILTLIFIMIFATLFFAIQAYTETFHMVKIGGNIINQTVVHNPELLHFLPDGWEDKLDSVLNNTYTYGRVGISKMVFSALKGVKKEKVLEFEKTALELWDRVYQAWLMSTMEPNSNTMGPKVSSGAVSQTWTTFMEHVQKTPELMNMKTVSVLVNNNMAMLSSGLESVWVLLKANLGLVLQALTTLISLVFESGFTVFNFFINIIVFLTALFYLLSSSGNLYKPVQIITSVSPVYGNKLAVAIETAVHEVLTASFKLALFYGLWTWLIHSLFGVQLVYIPSAFASLLAAVPVLGPYWACVPGVMDLYLAQGKRLKAVSLLIFQILPTFFVDTAIFNEIQGGHPYLTGLSVAGGVFWLGIEGAIIGPLMLCCLFVIVNMSTAIMKESVLPTPVMEKFTK